jgi:gluconolactonase
MTSPATSRPAARVLAAGFQFPEGPIARPDGSVLLVEIRRGTLTRVDLAGGVEVVARLGGGPNGAAIGPDGRVYVCNNGGFEWHERRGMVVPGNQPADYAGGSIQAVDLASGKVETLYRRCGDVALRGPNDLVFDRSGGFWFTDNGKSRARERDRTGVFYARPDGSSIVEAIFPVEAPNGLGLSPAEDRLYVAETVTGRVFWWELDGPGTIRPNPRSPNGGHFLAGVGGLQMFDSMAIEENGNVCVATLINGGVTVISPDGAIVEHVPTGDPLTTNVCFGGRDRRTAYVTLSGGGRLVAIDWPRPGLPLAFQ